MTKHRKYLFLVGTYTDKGSEGIYAVTFDADKERFAIETTCKVENPSFIVLSKDRRFIYSVSENPDSESWVNSCSLDQKEIKIDLVSRINAEAEGACHAALDPREKFLITANYASGSISVFSVEKGNLAHAAQVINCEGESQMPERQDASHVHCAGFSPDGKYLFACDLGTDSIYRFELDYDGEHFVRTETLKVFDVEPGTGPRHLTFSPDGKWLYLITELTGSIMVFSYSDGELSLEQSLPVSDSPQEGGGAIEISPDGKYLYGSLRDEHDGIGIFEVKKGLLEKKGYVFTATHPRHISLSPDGKYLLCAAMNDNRIDAYEVASDGSLEKTDGYIEIASPSCIIFV